ncbi:MAG: hypothetical protein LBM25_04835 [Bacteroidales bacterium]|jgi:hypothetical protein|nr:hypothetical protein [Bacteroidales bacterium]
MNINFSLIKNSILFLSIAFLLTSCLSNKRGDRELKLENLEPFQTKIAPIKEGYQTLITIEEDTICLTNIEMTYLIGKGEIETITYIPQAKDVVYGGYDWHRFTACFEDIRYGDNDYNDFVCYISAEKKEKKVGNSYNVTIDYYIQPIAFGSGQNLRFGLTLPDMRDTIISDSVRKDMFIASVDDIGLFVNTADPLYVYLTCDRNHIRKITWEKTGVEKNQQWQVHPFIINEAGEKLYVALNTSSLPASSLQIVGVYGYPLGIATKNAFMYPLEKKNINTCYSGFNDWILGNTSSLGGVTNINNCFHTIHSSGLFKNNPQNLF